MCVCNTDTLKGGQRRNSFSRRQAFAFKDQNAANKQ